MRYIPREKEKPVIQIPKIDSLWNGYFLGGQPGQVGLAIKAWNMAKDPKTFQPRLNRLKAKLVIEKVKALGLHTSVVRKLEDQFERLLIDKYIKWGGDVFYRSFKAPRGTRSTDKCKPYRRIQND